MVYLWVRRSLQQGPEACRQRYVGVREPCFASFLVVDLAERSRFVRVPDHGSGGGSDHGDDLCPLKTLFAFSVLHYGACLPSYGAFLLLLRWGLS